jgi:hypothetical protein
MTHRPARITSLRRALIVLTGSLVIGGGGSAQTGANFDHSTTRFPLTGSHRREPCESCHLEGLFQGTPDRCELCHDGSGLRAETSKPANHVTSSNRCDDCHDTVLWNRVVFDHAGVTERCEACHNGISATGKSMNHVATNADCALCHSTRAWLPARFDHSMVTGSCSSCHDGITAAGTSPGHFNTTLDCNTCHNTVDWQPIVFRHTSANYPGDHRSALACTQCHTSNSESIPWPSPAYAPDCAACHANDFKRDAHKKVDSPTIYYTVDELRDCSGACHQYTDGTFTTILRTRSGQHRVSDGSFN